MEDLKDRGLLESTMVVWMGEFGRTPGINPQGRSRPFPSRVVGCAGWRRHSRRAGYWQNRRGRGIGHRSAAECPRSAGNSLLRFGDRS